MHPFLIKVSYSFDNSMHYDYTFPPTLFYLHTIPIISSFFRTSPFPRLLFGLDFWLIWLNKGHMCDQ